MRPSRRGRSFIGRRERRRARALGEIVRIRPIGADRGGDLVVADQRDPRRALEDDVERLFIGNARRHAVGKRIGAAGGHDAARGERKRVGWRFARLHADDFRLQAQSVARGNAAANSRALPDRDVKNVEVGALAQEFERVGRDAERQIAVEGRNQCRPRAPASRIASSRAA